MLDLAKLAGQIPGISNHLRLEAVASRQRLERAEQLLAKAKTQQESLVKSHQEWRDRMIFTAATPVESLDTCVDISSPPESHSVFATDGSQISPSHHEILYCYVINVGRIMLHYGQSLYPLLDSVPEVFYRPEDLYISRQWGIRTEEWMGHRRTISEVSMLAEMACRWVNPPAPHRDTPNLAIVDGSLIYWFLDGMPGEARDRILPPILTAWEQLRAVNVPLIGYLSASRSVEMVNFLRLPACPYETPKCITQCGNLTDKLPCQVIDPLRDTTLWASLLQPGQRSPLFQSSARILELYDHHRIYFCYVHVGTEIARIEMPEWVAQNSALLNQALSLMLGQVYKGYGYPIAVSEAHNQAVIKAGDRNRFFALLEQQMIRAGVKNVGISYKEARKRGSIS
ncbi:MULTISPECIES: DNA double-strand break repair nuclease NurA [unclassified Moorena]|uniref:DNA double-strand break repair nuclease NurA n=1 Tax=unclassified Moorena TaxID=2683338 RepID=UPI0013F8B578|nr:MULTISPECIES: DNA double-strand break repair nuclease NurA [unclassified Moorena]NEO12841.1 DNA double-strand break repair nuclease NurA [Moorena sp. SIO3E8]NEP27499.1 DNA double-strand break repair nuclease NurA [Moorena sp. SIO3I6]NEQ01645.1 DNA double-strand break repair nuclease NurA [Moorena sp. SIO3F7]